MINKLKKNFQEIKDSVTSLKKFHELRMTPIEKHIYLNYQHSSTGLNHIHYEKWTMKRINKILEILGVDYFKNKKILELGGGHGEIGAFFAELGAEVLCLEGRIQNVNIAKLKHRMIKNFHVEVCDLENDFSQHGKFDLIFDFGLLYHLKNVKGHLEQCTKISKEIFLETVVCDSTDPKKIIFVDEDKTKVDEALQGVGSRPSPFYIESIFEQQKFQVNRIFSPDLNSESHSYDWQHKNTDLVQDNLRRFWYFKKT